MTSPSRPNQGCGVTGCNALALSNLAGTYVKSSDKKQFYAGRLNILSTSLQVKWGRSSPSISSAFTSFAKSTYKAFLPPPCRCNFLQQFSPTTLQSNPDMPVSRVQLTGFQKPVHWSYFAHKPRKKKNSQFYLRSFSPPTTRNFLNWRASRCSVRANVLGGFWLKCSNHICISILPQVCSTNKESRSFRLAGAMARYVLQPTLKPRGFLTDKRASTYVLFDEDND